MCREPDGQWVQVGIISFTSKCAQEDTPVLLTDMAAHSSWLGAHVHGAAFLVQDPGAVKMSDENSCVGGCEHGHPTGVYGDTQATSGLPEQWAEGQGNKLRLRL